MNIQQYLAIDSIFIQFDEREREKMSDEVKTVTPKKTTTTRKKTQPKVVNEVVEEPVVAQAQPVQATIDINELALQMASMQQMMMSMMSQMTQGVQQPTPVEPEPVQEQPKRVRKTIKRKEEGLTRQELRRKYKDTDIYVTSALFGGSVCFNGEDVYIWRSYGECLPVTITDILNMEQEGSYLTNPWLVLDDYENSEEVLEDIITCLKLEKSYRHLFILRELDENINNVKVSELAEMIREDKQRGGTLDLDATTIIQVKITKGELESSRKIGEFEKAVGRKFKKD